MPRTIERVYNASVKTAGFLIFLLGIAVPAFALPEVKTYDQLIHAIREVRAQSDERIEQAVDQEKVREAWETGKLIQEHILLNEKRAEYGQQVLKRLSGDLGASDRELRYMVKFAKTYPIWTAPSKLSWSHYRELLSINDDTQRREFVEQAAKENWSQKRTRQEIRKRHIQEMPPPQLSEAKPGKRGVYRVVDRSGKNYYDLGFSTYSEVRGKVPQTEPLEEDLYTYEAQVTEVIDGDTFHALVDLGFGILREERLRLRQLDAEEILSSEGKEAKAALEKILGRSKGPVLIRVEKKDDNYGRYLADVWVNGKNIARELLDTGLLTLRGDE